MRYTIFLILIMISNICFAERISVECWSQNKIIFNQTVNEVIPGEGYIVTTDNMVTTVITGDCVIRYRNPPKKKH